MNSALQLTFMILLTISSIGVVVLILLQQGKGSDGGAFGAGSSASLFGASGSANVMTRSTAILASVFFLSCIGLTWAINHKAVSLGVVATEVAAKPAAAAQKAVQTPVNPVQSVPSKKEQAPN